jgi:DNA-binding GntR family transcriptional regulator
MALSTRDASSTDPVATVAIDRASPVPLYYQVAQELQRLIETDALPTGDRLTNEITMAAQLGVSRPTMRRALQYLVDRGLLMRKRGVGTQVVRRTVRRPLELTSLYDDLRRAGRHPTSRVLAAETTPADPEVAQALAVAPGSPVFRLRRLRLADGAPLALLPNYLSCSLLDVAPETFESTGLYDLIRAAGVHITVAEQIVGAAKASAPDAGLLDEPRGAPLLTMRRTAYDEAGTAVEFGNHLYRASRYSFSLTLVEH